MEQKERTIFNNLWNHSISINAGKGDDFIILNRAMAISIDGGEGSDTLSFQDLTENGSLGRPPVNLYDFRFMRPLSNIEVLDPEYTQEPETVFLDFTEEDEIVSKSSVSALEGQWRFW
ncbi:MAG: hypothetical protein V6Z86_07200 [Hyphomicrobiales bacterium]